MFPSLFSPMFHPVSILIFIVRHHSQNGMILILIYPNLQFVSCNPKLCFFFVVSISRLPSADKSCCQDSFLYSRTQSCSHCTIRFYCHSVPLPFDATHCAMNVSSSCTKNLDFFGSAFVDCLLGNWASSIVRSACAAFLSSSLLDSTCFAFWCPDLTLNMLHTFCAK